MKKCIYQWSDNDFTQTIRMDDDNEIFEIETIYAPQIGIDRKLTFVDRYMVEAMNTELERKKVGKNEKGSAQENRKVV